MLLEENKAMVRRMAEAINQNDMDVMDERRMEITELVAEGNTVVGRSRCSGTNQGEFKGVPPTGRHMEVDEVYFLRVEDGKFVYFWGLEDDLARLRQLGLVPSPEQSDEASPT